MKLAALAPVVLAASAALAFPGYSRAYSSDVVKARQAKVHRALVVDVCASIDVNLGAVISGLGDLIDIDLDLDICLCLSLVESFCGENPATQAVSAVVGVDVVVDVLTGLINNAQNKQSCTYPEHAQALCTDDNPCGFGCGDGYAPYTPAGAPHPSKCYCPPPSTECNGKCGSFPQGCGSAAPAPYKRVAKRAETCAAGRSVCGVQGGKGWECVDTLEDKESCGGCMVPSPFGVGASGFEQGTDCTAIAHVASGGVECQSGVCFVHTCVDGFAPSLSHDSCVSVLHSGQRKRDA